MADSQMSESARQDGWYWVKWRESTEWSIAFYDPQGDRGDGVWCTTNGGRRNGPVTLGPRIPSPDEAQPAPIAENERLERELAKARAEFPENHAARKGDDLATCIRDLVNQHKGMAVTSAHHAAANQHFGLRDHMLCRQIGQLQMANARKKRAVVSIRVQRDQAREQRDKLVGLLDRLPKVEDREEMMKLGLMKESAMRDPLYGSQPKWYPAAALVDSELLAEIQAALAELEKEWG